MIEVLRKLVSNKKFAGMMREKINMEVDTSSLDQEIATYEKTLRQCYLNKDDILSPVEKHFIESIDRLEQISTKK